MAKYVALLRGIGPSNPNMHGARLKSAVESLGYKNVSSFLSSGNILFETDLEDLSAIEEALEAVWPSKLGFNSMTIVRSQSQLQALASKDPYKGVKHGNLSKSYQLVTFFKTPTKSPPKGNYYSMLGVNALCNSIDNSGDLRTPDFMAQLDRQFGKDQITSRTWNTITRILAKM